MNNKLRRLIIVFITFLLVIFLLNILIKKIETNKSDITDMNILNYIPNDYELTILSNSTSNSIKRYLNEDISDKQINELKKIKESIFSYLGFDFKEKIERIYDNEFALTFIKNKLNKIDVLLIFKLKKNKDLNDIFNIGEEFNKSDQIIELKRPGKLNYINHIFKTKDSYIIASSNKQLIDNSIKSNNRNNIFSRTIIPEDINFNEIKLLSISKYINSENSLTLDQPIVNKIITIINSEGNNIKLRSFSTNIDKVNLQILNNQIDNVKDIIFSNKYSTYKRNINFLYKDINQKEFLEEIYQELNEEVIFITNNNNWVLSFKNALPNNIQTNEFNSLKKYKKEDLSFNNINYSIYTNDRLKIQDNNIIYQEENPIFSLKDGLNTYISNNFEALLDMSENNYIFDQFLNKDNKIKLYKYILNDIFFIKEINNLQLVKYYKSLKNLQYFINTELFSLEDININIRQVIPERQEKLYLESNLKIL